MEKERLLTIPLEGMLRTEPKFNVVGAQHTIMDRGISDYELILGVNVESLKGKTVLDIGCGYGRFLEQCKHLGITVIGLDPEYQFQTFKNKLNSPEDRKDKIAGIHEMLPFKTGSFDVILNCFASIYYVSLSYPEIRSSREMAKKMIEETIRVLKVGGEARMGPEFILKESDKKFFNNILWEIAKTHNISWTFSNEKGSNRYIILHKN